MSCLRGEKRVIFGCQLAEKVPGLGSEMWPRLRLLAIKYHLDRLVSFSSNNVFRYHVLLACFCLSFSSAVEDTEGQRL